MWCRTPAHTMRSQDLLQPPTPLFSSSPSSLTVAHLSSTLSAVSLLLTPSLARDLAPDLLSLLSHSRAAVRKQTVLVMWRVVRSWPGVKELGTGREERGEDPWIERLRERLGDEDLGVVSATVNLICEMARKDPRQYLPLAPELFELLTASTNNWMLIKIIKLVSSCLHRISAASLTRSFTVCRPHARRAKARSQARSAIDRTYRDDSRHVPPLRVHSDLYRRRHAQRT